jgi:hypothetical protein
MLRAGAQLVTPPTRHTVKNTDDESEMFEVHANMPMESETTFHEALLVNECATTKHNTQRTKQTLGNADSYCRMYVVDRVE